MHWAAILVLECAGLVALGYLIGYGHGSKSGGEKVGNREGQADAEFLSRVLFEDGPLKHDCENCGDSAMAPVSKLPSGWRLIATHGKLFDSLDEVDENSRIVCPLCAAVVEDALKKVPKVPKFVKCLGRCRQMIRTDQGHVCP